MASKIVEDLGKAVKLVGDNAAKQMEDYTSEVVINDSFAYQAGIDAVKAKSTAPTTYASAANSLIEITKNVTQANLEAELDPSQIEKGSTNLKNAVQNVAQFGGETGDRIGEASKIVSSETQNFISTYGNFEFFRNGLESVEEFNPGAKLVLGDEEVNFDPGAKEGFIEVAKDIVLPDDAAKEAQNFHRLI